MSPFNVPGAKLVYYQTQKFKYVYSVFDMIVFINMSIAIAVFMKSFSDYQTTCLMILCKLSDILKKSAAMSDGLMAFGEHCHCMYLDLHIHTVIWHWNSISDQRKYVVN